MESNKLLCFGNALVDIFAYADAARLDELGIGKPVQHIGADLARLLLDEFGGAADTQICAGGGAANAAKIAAMLHTGAAFAGTVGADANGAFFKEDLNAAGVAPFVNCGDAQTGVCFVFSCGSRKPSSGKAQDVRIAVWPGAAMEFTEADVREELIAGADALALDGYMLDRPRLAQRVMQLADRRGIPVALDVASVFQVQEKTEAVLLYSRIYPLIIFMNADESIVFYHTIKKNIPAIDMRSEKEKEAFILKEICPVLKYMTEGEIFPVLVIKLGGRGVVVLAGGNIYRQGTFTVNPRNTVGAGDAFCAAFMSAWIRGRPIRECAALGNKVARKILQAPGTKIKAAKLKSLARLFR